MMLKFFGAGFCWNMMLEFALSLSLKPTSFLAQVMAGVGDGGAVFFINALSEDFLALFPEDYGSYGKGVIVGDGFCLCPKESHIYYIPPRYKKADIRVVKAYDDTLSVRPNTYVVALESHFIYYYRGVTYIRAHFSELGQNKGLSLLSQMDSNELNSILDSNSEIKSEVHKDILSAVQKYHNRIISKNHYYSGGSIQLRSLLYGSTCFVLSSLWTTINEFAFSDTEDEFSASGHAIMFFLGVAIAFALLTIFRYILSSRCINHHEYTSIASVRPETLLQD